MSVQLRIGDGLPHVADEFLKMGVLAPPSIGGTPVVLALDVADAEAVFAQNLLLDMPARLRNVELAALKQRLGEGRLESIVPVHALDGRFTMVCANGRLRGEITLSPDADPGIQDLTLEVEPS